MRKRICGMLLLLCALAVMAPAASVSAAKVQNGWDAAKTHYYKNGKAVTGLQKISGKTYYFNKKGKLQVSQFKTLEVKKKTYTFYFGANGAAYKAAKNAYSVYMKVFKINGKEYGFDENCHMVTGPWVTAKEKAYVFKDSGVCDTAKTKKLRKLVKYNKTSKTLVTDIEKVLGKPEKMTESSSCNPFPDANGKYDKDKDYVDYSMRYPHVDIQLTKNTKTGVYLMNGMFALDK